MRISLLGKRIRRRENEEMIKKTRFSIFVILVIICLIGVVSAEVIINEIMHSPTQCDDNYCEYIEIFNNGSTEINLTDWKLCSNPISAGYINNSDGLVYRNESLILAADTLAIITDGGSGTNISNNFNIPAEALMLHISASSLCNGGLTNNKNISLYNNSNSIVSWVNYTSAMGADGNDKSLQYCSGNWTENAPTPGSSNNCTTPPQPCAYNSPLCSSSWSTCIGSVQNKTCTNVTATADCLNLTYYMTQTCTIDSENSGITINMTWDEAEIENGREFEITLSVDNLESRDYAVKVWIENDNSDIISERYGNYSDEGEKWKSGNYYIYNFFRGPGDETETIKLRIREAYRNFSGEAVIYFKLTNTSEIEIHKDIEILEFEEQTANSEDSIDSPPLASNNTSNNAPITGGAIRLGGSSESQNKNVSATRTSTANSIIYKSKREYMKEYSLYGFSILCIGIIIILLIDKRR